MDLSQPANPSRGLREKMALWYISSYLLKLATYIDKNVGKMDHCNAGGFLPLCAVLMLGRLLQVHRTSRVGVQAMIQAGWLAVMNYNIHLIDQHGQNSMDSP